MIHRKNMTGWLKKWFTRSKPGNDMPIPEKRANFKEKWMNNWTSTTFQLHDSSLFLRKQELGHSPKTSNRGANSIYPTISYICL